MLFPQLFVIFLHQQYENIKNRGVEITLSNHKNTYKLKYDKCLPFSNKKKKAKLHITPFKFSQNSIESSKF